MKSVFSVRKPVLAAALLGAFNAYAAENLNVRVTGGTVGREIFTPTAAGHYGTVNVIYYDATKLKDNNGDALVSTATAGTNVIPVNVDFKQTQLNLLLRYVYVSEHELFGAKLGVTAALPITHRKRHIALTPNFPVALPTPARNAVNANLIAQEAFNNGSDDGFSDLEVSPVMTWESENTKIAFSPTVILPTGQYDKSAALNAGQGDFYTFRPAVTLAYVSENGIQAGVRVLYGVNTKNKATNVKTGSFYSIEPIVFKEVTSKLNVGLSAFVIDQLGKDSGPNVPSHGNKLRLYGAGVSASYRTPVGPVELKLNQEFNGKNTREGYTVTLRFAKTF
jgi:hypothetical protein